MITGTYEVRTARRWQREFDISFPAALALVRYNNAALEETAQYQQLLDWASTSVVFFAAHFWEARYEQVAAVPGEVRSVMQCLLYDIVPDTAHLAELLPNVHDLLSNVHLLGRDDASTVRLRFSWWNTERLLRAVIDCLADIFEVSNRMIDCVNSNRRLPREELAAVADRYVRLLSSAIRSAEEFSEMLERFIHAAKPQRLYAPLTPWTYVHETASVMWHCSSRLEHYAGYLLGEDRTIPRRAMRPFPADEDENIVWF